MKNLAKGDLRLIGVNGYSCSLPGRPIAAQEKLAQQNGMYCLDGTSDAGLFELNDQAASYAARCNAALVKLLPRQAIKRLDQDARPRDHSTPAGMLNGEMGANRTKS